MFSLFLSALISNACSWQELLFPFLPRISLGSPSLPTCLWWILGSFVVEQLQFGSLEKIWLQKRHAVWKSIISSFASLGHTFVVLRVITSVEEDSFLALKSVEGLWWEEWGASGDACDCVVMLILGMISQRIMNRKMAKGRLLPHTFWNQILD